MDCLSFGHSANSNIYDASVCSYENSGGVSEIAEYKVFKGINLCYYSIHTDHCCFQKDRQGDFFFIHHCREGRMEFHIQNEFCYIAQGDLLIARTKDMAETSSFPMRHHHGISVLINIEEAPKCLSCILEDVNIQPIKFAEKFCTENACFIARANPSFEHIFSELYSVPNEIRKGYFKIKILELLLFLSALDTRQDEFSKRSLAGAQVSLAKAVSQYLINQMDERITIEELSSHFHVSGTYIKNTFKAVYGVSVYSYIRARKMESAAYMLEHTEKSILEIAGEHGYDNGSKFANAFRAIKGMTPSEYRNLNNKK